MKKIYILLTAFSLFSCSDGNDNNQVDDAGRDTPEKQNDKTEFEKKLNNEIESAISKKSLVYLETMLKQESLEHRIKNGESKQSLISALDNAISSLRNRDANCKNDYKGEARCNEKPQRTEPNENFDGRGDRDGYDGREDRGGDEYGRRGDRDGYERPRDGYDGREDRGGDEYGRRGDRDGYERPRDGYDGREDRGGDEYGRRGDRDGYERPRDGYDGREDRGGDEYGRRGDRDGYERPRDGYDGREDRGGDKHGRPDDRDRYEGPRGGYDGREDRGGDKYGRRGDRDDKIINRIIQVLNTAKQTLDQIKEGSTPTKKPGRSEYDDTGYGEAKTEGPRDENMGRDDMAGDDGFTRNRRKEPRYEDNQSDEDEDDEPRAQDMGGDDEDL